MMNFDLGVMFRREDLPENVVKYSQQAESAGFDELWIVEDCFYASGTVPVVAALAATERIRVGLGIMPAVARNVAFTALEIATLARLYPRRFVAGLGHGVYEWMEQIGALPVSQLAALGETTEVLRALLRGEVVTFAGEHVNLSEVQLVFPPEDVPPVLLGVRGPRSLHLAGRSADGTLLAEGSSPAYVRWAREQIDQGRAAAQHTDPHRVTVYAWCAVNDNPAIARDQVRPMLARTLVYASDSYLKVVGIGAEVRTIIAEGGDNPVAHMINVMPDEWLHDFTLVGTSQQVIEAIYKLVEAGVDSVVLVPTPTGDYAGQLKSFAEKILPELQ